MHEKHKMSPRDWPYNLWDDIVAERKRRFVKAGQRGEEDELLKGFPDDPYPPEPYFPNLEKVMANTLTEVQQKVLRLRYGQKLTYKQVGEALGVCGSRARAASRDGLLRLTRPENFFRLKAVPESEVRSQIWKFHDVDETIKQMEQESEALKERIRNLESQKSCLKLVKECHSTTCDALNAHIAIVFTRYMMLSVAKRRNEDDKTICELFYVLADEMEDITFSQSMRIILEALMEAVMQIYLLSFPPCRV